MEEAPADASSLIYLAKAAAFADAALCVPTILVTPRVWREAVSEGERVGAPEVGRIREAADHSSLRRVALDQDEQRFAGAIASQYRIGLGESEVLAVARRSGNAVVDEGRATRVAQALGIAPVATLFLPIFGFDRGNLSLREAIQLVGRLAVPANATAEAVFAIEKELRRRAR